MVDYTVYVEIKDQLKLFRKLRRCFETEDYDTVLFRTDARSKFLSFTYLRFVHLSPIQMPYSTTSLFGLNHLHIYNMVSEQ